MFILTSRFKQNPDEVYSAAASCQLPFPTPYTPAIVEAAKALLARVYRPGFVYHKAGVFLIDIVADDERQQSLIFGIDHERRARLMEAVDGINRKHGRHTIRSLAMGFDREWEMRCRQLSGRYTTRLHETLRVKAK